ncbi:MAG: hypothetical protein ABI439_06205 [Rhodospirillales bacterium]
MSLIIDFLFGRNPARGDGAPLRRELPPLRQRLGWIAGPHRLSIGAGQAIYWALLAVPIVWMAGYLFPPINHDVGAELDVAARWLAGEKLYIDIIDINTPLVFILHAVPELLARIALSGAQWMSICTILGVLISSYYAVRALKYLPSAQQPLLRAFLPVTILFLLAVFPNDMFGQREHLLLIFGLPYLMLAAARAEGAVVPRSLRIGIGIAAGIAFSLKPHFLLYPALIELYVLYCVGWRNALKDVLPWAVLGTIAAHVAFMLIVTPQYVTFLFPIILRFYSQVGDADTWDVVTGGLMLPTLLVLVPLAAFALFVSKSKLTHTIALWVVCGVIICVVQSKGWRYQAMPALAGTLLLAAITIAEMIDRYLPRERTQQRLPVAVLTATFMILFYYQQALSNQPFYKQVNFEDSVTAILIHIVETQAPNKRILVLSPGIYPHYPLVNYTGARMTMRFQTMWLLQGVYANCEEYAPLYNSPDQMSNAEKFIYTTVAQDFAQQRPDLIIVDKVAGIPKCQWRSFNYLEYFMRNPQFAQAFRHYQFYMDFDRYVIYSRR